MSPERTEFLNDFDFIFPGTRKVRGYDVAGAQKHIQKFIAGAPEVMVKISSYSKTGTGLKMHVDYISRQSELPVYDSSGHEFTEIQAALDYSTKEHALHARINDLVDANSNTHESHRLTANIVLSMPPGVHEESFRNGVKHFLIDQYDGHDYLYTFHDDQDHYHAHIVVATESYDGQRLSTNRDDLQHWRERFAMHLEREGIAADATPAYSRGEASKNVPRWLSETVDRGTNQREAQSPTYDAEKEQTAIKERGKAWNRISAFITKNNIKDLTEPLGNWVKEHFTEHRQSEIGEDREGR